MHHTPASGAPATRRRVLHAASVGLAGAAALPAGSCAFGRPVPPPLTEVSLLAPGRPEHAARAAAWNASHPGAPRVALAETGPVAGDPAGDGRAVALLAAGQRAGIAWVDELDVPALVRQRGLRALGDLVARDRYDLKRFMPAALQPAYGVDGRLSTLPAEITARQLYFNHQHFVDAGIDFQAAGFDFQDPALTWEGLRRANLGLVAAYPGRDRLPFVTGHSGAPLELWGWQNGASWLHDGGRRAAFDLPVAVEALAWLAAHGRELGDPLRQALLEFPPPARAGTDDDRPQDHPLLAGRVSVCFETDRLASTVVWAQPSFPLGYVQPPRRAPEAPVASFSHSWGYGLLPDSADVAWEIQRFLVGETAARAAAGAVAARAPQASFEPAAAQAQGFLPGRRRWYPPFTGQLTLDRLLHQIYRSGHKLLDDARGDGLEQLRYARARPPCLAPDEIWPLLEEARRQAILGVASARDALATAQRQAQAALDGARR